MASRLLKPELVIRAAFLVFGSTYEFFGLAMSLNENYTSGEAWRGLIHHPSPFLFVGAIFFYFGLRKRSILATLRGESKDAE
jgi:hypothetical protein